DHSSRGRARRESAGTDRTGFLHAQGRWRARNATNTSSFGSRSLSADLFLNPMSFDKVLKFGGAALADGPCVLRACKIIQRHGGTRPVVVVSAHQGVTDLLDTVTRS